MSVSHKIRVRLLYKTILRLHKGLPIEIRPLGDSYARDEFKRHKTCTESEGQVFITEWTNYAIALSEQLGLGIRGKPKEKIGDHLGEENIEKLRDEQIVQLYELLQAATGKLDNLEDKSTDTQIIDKNKNS